MIARTMVAASALLAIAGCAGTPEVVSAPVATAAATPAPAPPVAAPAVTPAPAPTPPPAPAPRPRIESVEKPTYISIPMEITVNKPAKDVWARIGKYCDISEWFQIAACTMTSGKEGEVGSVRSVGSEILIGKTELSYGYTQPVRDGRPYNLYHGWLEARPIDAKTSKIVYTLMYDNSLVPGDQAAKDAEIAGRRTRFEQGLKNMKILAEGGKLPAPAAPAARPATPPAAAAAPATPAATPARARIESVEKPNYVSIPMEITVAKPAKDVWARIGKYCGIGEWLQIGNCTMVSGKEGEVGSVRSVAGEILVGKTDLSYSYTQPVRDGRAYNLYHGTLEARPVDAKSSKLVYTLMYDNSMVAGDQAAKDAEMGRRRTQFETALKNMKTLAEGGTLPPRAAPAAPAAPATPRPQ